MPHNRIRVLLGLVAAGWSATAAISSPAAHADQYDFVSQLDAQGIYYRDINGVINDGKLVCGWLRDGTPVPTVVNRAQTEGGFPGQSAAYLVYDAANTMCPDTLPRLQAAANQGQGLPQHVA